jgi:tetratricopeptide (TPR) repeat protein
MLDRSLLLLFLCLGFGMLLAPWRTAAHDTWIEIRSPHFTVLCNAGESEGRKTALQFENVRALFLQLYPKSRVDPGKPTVIFAIKNEDSLKLFIPAYGQNSKTMHLGGFYSQSYDKNFVVVRTDIRGNGPLGFHVVYHEYTHSFFHYNYRGLPLWLDEGLAEFYGNTNIESKEAGVGMANTDQLRYLKEITLLPLDQLLSIDRSSPLYNTRDHWGIFYAESWALVHYLSNSPEMRAQRLLDKYLEALHTTDDPIEAASQTFGDLKKFSEKLEVYIHSQAFLYERVPLQSKLSEKDFPARVLSPAEATLAQADFLMRAAHLPEALEELHEVEKLDAATPGYHADLGHYHLLKSDYGDAEKELQLALAANPNDFSALLDMTYVYYRRDGYSKESTPKIREELEKVANLSPDFAPAQAFLSIAYTQEPDKDTDKAVKSALRAAQLEPGSLAYFIDIGKALLAAGRIPEAKKIAEKAQKVATTSSDRALTAAFSKQIDYKVDHPRETVIAKNSDSDSAPQDSAASATSDSTAQAEGQITELLCGRPPEVLLTLATTSNSLLLHVSDIAKISIQDGANASDATQMPCSKWKDRHAKVEYRAKPSGMAQGEVQSIALE